MCVQDFSPVPQSQDVFWSPSEMIGLSTPPPSQRATPATNILENSGSHLTQSGTYIVLNPSKLSLWNTRTSCLLQSSYTLWYIHCARVVHSSSVKTKTLYGTIFKCFWRSKNKPVHLFRFCCPFIRPHFSFLNRWTDVDETLHSCIGPEDVYEER